MTSMHTTKHKDADVVFVKSIGFMNTFILLVTVLNCSGQAMLEQLNVTIG